MEEEREERGKRRIGYDRGEGGIGENINKTVQGEKGRKRKDGG